ncbi:Methionine ABC transporter ATP-binding protein [Actinokineospora spheciospongiae]|uniref:Methionine ABC transporter ATP-binding protein n=1 Tax=Actinokineospora spheciospongiae TaxID=909613 RepID=W7J2Y6_9PSEU|nr:Methionine ABC transporter ATP-binding protein [Actinokineospora spheciospongiae]
MGGALRHRGGGHPWRAHTRWEVSQEPADTVRDVLRIPRLRTRQVVVAAVVLVLAAAGIVWLNRGDSEAPVSTRDAFVELLSGPDRDQPVKIDTTLYLPETTPAPVVMVAHGFGGSKDSVDADAREFARRGFVALAWSARGFGRSEGEIGLNARDFEVADASGLVSWLAGQPEVSKTSADDPVVGVTGGSYGGALSLLLAGTDKRVDSLAPVITYNDLGQALLPNSATTGTAAQSPAANPYQADGVFKRSWAGIFFSAGLGGGGLGSPGAEATEPGSEDDGSSGGAVGTADPAAAAGAAQPDPGAARGGSGAASDGDACGRFTAAVCAAYAQVATTGRADQRTVELLRSVSPAAVTGDITQPTMLVQGEQDTLFGLDQADANARQISANGAPVKVVWYTGGHDGGRPGAQLRGQIADWFDFHLRGRGTDPGTGFEYAVEGALRAQGSPSVRTVSTDAYPGLTGGQPTTRTRLPISGPEQVVVNPPGGNPASISSLPGFGSLISGSSRLAGRLAVDLPGQVARFTSEPQTQQLLISGASTVRLRVAAPAGAPPSPEGAVLFAKLYDVAPDGTRTLPGSAVSAFRVPSLPADGSPAEVTVSLPGIVRPVEADHRVELAVTTTDQAYATPAAPASYRVSLAGDAALAVPVVAGTRSSTTVPVFPLVGIGVVLLVCAAAVVAGAVRRKRADQLDPELAGVPLVIENLSKSYPGGLKAVDDLSFTVQRGQVLGLLGPNGAGKTTTLRMLMGLIQPTAGEIRVFGHKIRSGAPVLSRIGSFVEGAGFLPHLSGRANLELYWAATGRPVQKAHFDEALDVAGLGAAVERKVKTYSQGMRQRLAIAQAMLGFPDLMVLDEPTNGLDPPQIHQMREVLRRYAATGRTVVVSSHLLAEVEQTCDHVVVMHRGRLVASGKVEDIVAGGGEATFRVDDTATAAEALRGVTGVNAVTVEGEHLVHADLADGVPRSTALGALVRAGVAVEQAGPRRRLEDAFLQLVGEESSG